MASDGTNRQLFLSCVSNEFAKREAPFGETRQKLDKYLRRAKCQVESQENFRQHGDATLDLLDAYLRECRAVIHLVGTMPGSVAAEDSPEAVAKLLKKLADEGKPFLAGQPDALREAVGDGSDLTYTQWEAFLALHHGVPLFVYHTEAGPKAQETHVERLRMADPQRFGSLFTNSEDLLGQLIGDLGEILPNLPERKPFNLPGSIGELFKGRESFLERIRETLRSSPGAITQAAQTISGLGGIGKSRLAIEFGYRHADDYAALFFLSADSPESLRRNLAELTGPLVLDLPEYEADSETRLAAALRWLETHERWFLILDNVDDEEAAQAVEDLLPRLAKGDVLITSRLGKGWSQQVKTLDLEVLDDSAARDFLLERTAEARPESETDNADLDALLDELDGLALALEEAGAYIAEREITFAEYLRRFREQKEKVLDWHDERAMQYPASVAATWQTSFDQLDGEARDLLNQLSFLAPEPIPRAIVPEDEEGALIALRRLSLVRFLDDPPENFIVHRLVQEIIRTRLGDQADAAWERLIALLHIWAPSGGQDIVTWEKWAAFEPHAEAVFDRPDRPSHATEICDLLDGFASFQFFRNGAYSAAERLYRLALKIGQRVLGDEHPITLNSLNNLALLLQAKGQFDEAEPLSRRGLEVRQRVLGDEHPDTLNSLNNLALLLHTKGESDDAEPLYRHALEVCQSVLGDEHPGTLTILNNLAGLLQDKGESDEAEPLFRRALEVCQRVFGDEHPGTLTTLNNLAALLQAKGQSNEAEPLFRHVLEIRQRVLGGEHPDTLSSLNNLAGLLRGREQYEEAEPLYRCAVAGLETKLGPDHPNTMIARANWETCVAALKEK